MKDNTVLITGASGGIGMALVEKFASLGYNVIGSMRSEKPEILEKWSEWSEKYTVSIRPVYFDLSDEESVKNALGTFLKDKDNPIEVLINNAGIPYGATAMMTPIKDLKNVMQINFFGAIYVSQLVAKSMIRRKNGSIVNISSVGGIESSPGYLAYGSSKAALIHATKIMAKELAGAGIRVNAVAPGLTETKMGHFKSEGELKKALDRTPAGRMAKPEEIAEVVAFLCSESASYITGEVVAVDGGRTA